MWTGTVGDTRPGGDDPATPVAGGHGIVGARRELRLGGGERADLGPARWLRHRGGAVHAFYGGGVGGQRACTTVTAGESDGGARRAVRAASAISSGSSVWSR